MKPWIFSFAIALAAGSAHARPFKELCEQFEPLRKISDLKYVKPRVLVEPKTEGVKAQDVVFTIEAKSGPIRVSPNAAGELTLPMTDALCAENPSFEVNQAKGSMSLSISIDPKIPPVQSLDYRLLEALRGEWKEAISRQSLVWRMLAPSSKAYQILFAPGSGASAEVRLPTGVRKLSADEKGELRIPFDDAWIAANPTIILSELPKRIGLAFKSPPLRPMARALSGTPYRRCRAGAGAPFSCGGAASCAGARRRGSAARRARTGPCSA